MAIKRHVQHIRSSVAESIPTSEQLGYGEIAINYNTDNERIFIKNASNEIVPFYSGKVIEENERIVAAALTDINDRVRGIENMNDNLEETEYSFLTSLIANSMLTPGKYYRITDYITTTAQVNTQSAGHAFDLVVLAVGKNVLSETAHAVPHDGDDYFAGADLGSWEIKYCYSNDTDRFSWADNENGKGVIYYMKDEWNNECPYDFKNIQFKHKMDNGSINDENGDDVFLYTFTYISGSEYVDGSHPGGTAYFRDNVILAAMDNNSLNTLNDIVIFTDNAERGCANNVFGKNCYGNILKSVNDNKFGDNCYGNTLGDGSSNNKFGDNCYGNTLGENCTDNVFGTECYSNTFGTYCTENSFGDGCFSNNFGDGCLNNTLIGQETCENVFGNDCNFNLLFNGCLSNVFGDNCVKNTLFQNATENSLSNGCSSNIFGQGAYRIVMGNDNISNVEVKSENKNITINFTNLDGAIIEYGVNNSTDIIQLSDTGLAVGVATYRPEKYTIITV